MSQQMELQFPVMPAEFRKLYLDPERVPSAKCPVPSPYYGFIGNKSAISKLIRIDFAALGRPNRLCRDQAIAFIGPPSVGKTDLAKRHAKANGLPLAEISPSAVKCAQDLLDRIRLVLDAAGLPLAEVDRPKHFRLPPMNIFIDEVHALSNKVVQALLKATEYKDAVMATEKGYTVDCHNVHWMIATTDRGKLFDAFDTRFAKISLNLYTKEEIAAIVKSNYPQWDMETCRLASHYCSKMPRETLAFARDMQLEYDMNPGDWQGIAAKIAEDSGIDPFGMSFKALNVIKALGQHPIASSRLPGVAGCKIEELDKFILPWLLESTPEQSPMISVTSKGYTITDSGLAELDRRLIPHNGQVAMAA